MLLIGYTAKTHGHPSLSLLNVAFLKTIGNVKQKCLLMFSSNPIFIKKSHRTETGVCGFGSMDTVTSWLMNDWIKSPNRVLILQGHSSYP